MIYFLPFFMQLSRFALWVSFNWKLFVLYNAFVPFRLLFLSSIHLIFFFLLLLKSPWYEIETGTHITKLFGNKQYERMWNFAIHSYKIYRHVEAKLRPKIHHIQHCWQTRNFVGRQLNEMRDDIRYFREFKIIVRKIMNASTDRKAIAIGYVHPRGVCVCVCVCAVHCTRVNKP